MTNYIPYILIALIVIVGVQTYFLLSQRTELKGLRASHELIDKRFEDQKEENTRLIDSLVKDSKKELIERQTKSIDSLTKLWNNRPKTPSYDPSIDNLNDTDSISKLFNRFYPNTNNP